MSEKKAESIMSNHWDIFQPSAMDLSTIEQEMTEYREINVTNTKGLTKYEIETKDRDAFLLPHEGYLEVRYKVNADDAGTAIPATDKVALQNNALSLFKNIEYLIEDNRIEYCDDPAIAHTVKNLSDFSRSYGQSVASNQHFYLDTMDLNNFAKSGLRFFNDNVNRRGYELFFIVSDTAPAAANRWTPTVASVNATLALGGTWVSTDVVIATYNGNPVIFTTSAPGAFGTKTVRTLAVGAAQEARSLVLSGGAAGDIIEAYVPATGENLIFFESDVRITQTAAANTQIYWSAAGANGTLLTGAGESRLEDNYNVGLQKRANLVSGSQLASAWIPLKNMYLFLRGFDKVTRGLRHRFVLNRQDDNQMLQKFGNQANRKVSIEYISAWIPRLKPDLETLNVIQKQLVSNDMVDINFTDLTLFRSANLLIGQASNTALQLATTTKKPVKVWVVFQKKERVDDSQTVNKRVFDFLGTTAIQCRLNGKIFPMYEYKFEAGNPQVGINRAYNAFLNSGHKMVGHDGSSLIDVQTWLSLYPVFYFDLEHQDEDLFKTQKYAELEIRWSNQAQVTAAAGYHIYCIYESERLIKLKGVAGSLALVM